MKKNKVEVKGIFVSLLFGGAAYYFASCLLSDTQAYLIGLTSFLVALWSNEALPLGVVSLFPIILFPSFDVLSVNEVTSNYAKPIIFLFLGGFFLAISVEKTGLHKVISGWLLRLFPNTVRGIICALSITAGILSSCLSNTTTTLLLIPLALYLTDELNIKVRFALAIAYGASIGGILTPIGTAPNLIYYGILEDKGFSVLPFLKWVIMVAPLAGFMFLFLGWLLSFGVAQKCIEPKIQQSRLTVSQKKVFFSLLLLTGVLFINSPIKPYYDGLGLNEKLLLLSFGLAMFIPPFSVLTWEDSKKVPFEIIFLFGAGFSIALAFGKTGLAVEVSESILSITHLAPLLILFIVATIVTFSTEITSNTALTSVMLPILYEVCIRTGLDVSLFLTVATICASYAFMLPIATPPNAIAMGTGIIHVKTMAKYGVILNLFGIIATVSIASFYWKHFLS